MGQLEGAALRVVRSAPAPPPLSHALHPTTSSSSSSSRSMRRTARLEAEDSALRYAHPDAVLHARRPTTAGSHLLPYINNTDRGRVYYP